MFSNIWVFLKICKYSISILVPYLENVGLLILLLLMDFDEYCR